MTHSIYIQIRTNQEQTTTGRTKQEQLKKELLQNNNLQVYQILCLQCLLWYALNSTSNKQVETLSTRFRPSTKTETLNRHRRIMKRASNKY